MPFKPMLAGKCTDTSALKYPVLISRKLDGVRCTVQGGILLSRSLKPIPNVSVQKLFKDLPEGIDGELIFGDPCSPSAYRDTVSIVMSDDKPADGINLHVFDKYEDKEFSVRIRHAEAAVNRCLMMEGSQVKFVKHVCCNNETELQETEEKWLDAGNEGVMIRSYEGPYKCGRSSEREGYLLKLKRFEDMEGVVVGTEEMQHNGNEAFRNELGRTARSSAKDGKSGMGVLGKLNLVGLTGPFKGVSFDCGTGFDAAMRTILWHEKVIGRIAKIKYFPVGSKDKPRHPVFLGWRGRRDM